LGLDLLARLRGLNRRLLVFDDDAHGLVVAGLGQVPEHLLPGLRERLFRRELFGLEDLPDVGLVLTGRFGQDARGLEDPLLLLGQQSERAPRPGLVGPHESLGLLPCTQLRPLTPLQQLVGDDGKLEGMGHAVHREAEVPDEGFGELIGGQPRIPRGIQGAVVPDPPGPRLALLGEVVPHEILARGAGVVLLLHGRKPLGVEIPPDDGVGRPVQVGGPGGLPLPGRDLEGLAERRPERVVAEVLQGGDEDLEGLHGEPGPFRKDRPADVVTLLLQDFLDLLVQQLVETLRRLPAAPDDDVHVPRVQFRRPGPEGDDRLHRTAALPGREPRERPLKDGPPDGQGLLLQPRCRGLQGLLVAQELLGLGHQQQQVPLAGRSRGQIAIDDEFRHGRLLGRGWRCECDQDQDTGDSSRKDATHGEPPIAFVRCGCTSLFDPMMKTALAANRFRISRLRQPDYLEAQAAHFPDLVHFPDACLLQRRDDPVGAQRVRPELVGDAEKQILAGLQADGEAPPLR